MWALLSIYGFKFARSYGPGDSPFHLRYSVIQILLVTAKITTSGWFTSWHTHKWPIHHGGKKRGIVLVLLHFVKSSKHISQRWHSFFHCSFLLLQWAMSDFPRNCDCVVFFIQFFKFTSIYLQHFFFWKPEVTRLLLVAQEKRGSFVFVNLHYTCESMILLFSL